MALMVKPEQEAVLHQQVVDGRFASTDDALEAAIAFFAQAYRIRTMDDMLAAFRNSPHPEVNLEQEKFKEVPYVRDIEF